MLNQGKRNDILKELEILEGSEVTCGNSCHKLKSRESLGEEYGLSGRTVANLLRVNELISDLKKLLDLGKLNFMAAVQLSFASEEIQKIVFTLGKPINKEMAMKLRKEGITAMDVIEIVCGTPKGTKASGKFIVVLQIRCTSSMQIRCA